MSALTIVVKIVVLVYLGLGLAYGWLYLVGSDWPVSRPRAVARCLLATLLVFTWLGLILATPGKRRMVDRYGVTRHGEQYTGWKALPASGAPLTRAEAFAVLRGYAPPSKRDDPLERLARWARVGAHPDKHAGDRSHHDHVLVAMSVLGLDT
jgi:hypothetical protein